MTPSRANIAKRILKLVQKYVLPAGRPQHLLSIFLNGNWPSLTIAFIAIVLSGFTFYVQFFNVTHGFQASVFNVSHKNGILKADILFHNSGNQYETLLEAYFFFPTKDDSLEGMRFGNKGVKSFVIKPDEQILNHYQGKIDTEFAGSFHKSTGESKAFPFGLKFKVVGRNMYPIERWVRVGSLAKAGNSTFTRGAVVDLTPD